jgi:hypothetical protein
MAKFDSVRNYGILDRSANVDEEVTETYEALIAGLCVMLPEDPWEFAVDKLTTLISSRPVSIEWDMFIDTDMKPKRHLFFRNIMDSLMDWDENSQVKTTKTFHIRI